MSVNVDALRARLAAQSVDALVVRSVDPHGSEYTSRMFKYLHAVTGFDGSVGTVIITSARVLLFCDPRYWEEAANTVFEGVEVVKEGDSDDMTPCKWMRAHLHKHARVAVDASQHTPASFDRLKRDLPDQTLVSLNANPIDAVWINRPKLPDVACWAHPEEIAGESVSSKLKKLRAAIKEAKCTGLVISALDEQMWMLNLRGGDITESPVAYAFTLVTATEATIFILGGKQRVSAEVRKGGRDWN